MWYDAFIHLNSAGGRGGRGGFTPRGRGRGGGGGRGFSSGMMNIDNYMYTVSSC